MSKGYEVTFSDDDGWGEAFPEGDFSFEENTIATQAEMAQLCVEAGVAVKDALNMPADQAPRLDVECRLPLLIIPDDETPEDSIFHFKDWEQGEMICIFRDGKAMPAEVQFIGFSRMPGSREATALREEAFTFSPETIDGQIEVDFIYNNKGYGEDDSATYVYDENNVPVVDEFGQRKQQLSTMDTLYLADVAVRSVRARSATMKVDLL